MTTYILIMAALVIFKHRGNIVRLIKGKESKFALKWGGKKIGGKKEEEEQPAESGEETR